MLATQLNHAVPSLQWGAVLSASLVAAAYDVRSRRIPNWLTGSLCLLGVLWTTTTHGLSGFLGGIEGCLIMGVPYVVLFVFAGGGAADAKLMGAIGVWLGPAIGLTALVSVMVAGAALGVAYAIRRRRLVSVAANVTSIAAGVVRMATGGQKLSEARHAFPDAAHMLTVPYGLAILAGTCVVALLEFLRHGGPSAWGAWI